MKTCRIGGPSGIAVEILTHGATIVSIEAPDGNGERANVVAHYASPERYVDPPHPKTYYGATIGRYANRIAHARFSLDGITYEVSANEGSNTLHGGVRGFDAREWDLTHQSASSVTLALTSADGDQGFPGELRCKVTFAVDPRSLRIEYDAFADADTVVSLTNHSYFNLSGGRRPAYEQLLQIFAPEYTPVDERLIPTGRIVPVQGTRFDFRAPKAIGPEKFDTNWALNGSGMKHAACLADPASGRFLDVHTTEPGLQMYSGNPAGIALETQHFPDSPNQPHFPSTILRKGERLHSTTIYEFSHR